jgi:hypothetical protein
MVAVQGPDVAHPLYIHTLRWVEDKSSFSSYGRFSLSESAPVPSWEDAGLNRAKRRQISYLFRESKPDNTTRKQVAIK